MKHTTIGQAFWVCLQAFSEGTVTCSHEHAQTFLLTNSGTAYTSSQRNPKGRRSHA